MVQVHSHGGDVGNVAGAREIYKRWMDRVPDQHGWICYVKFELRCNEIERARAVYERFVESHPRASVWIRFAKFEMKYGGVVRARSCYEKAVCKLGGDGEEMEELCVAFAEFEERCKETERARVVYKYALDNIPKGRAEECIRSLLRSRSDMVIREGLKMPLWEKRGLSMRMRLGRIL